MTPLIPLKIAGLWLLFIVAIHPYVARTYQWRAEAGRMSLLNRQIFGVHAFFIALMVGMMGLLLTLGTKLLLDGTTLARVVLLGLATFWAARLAIQIFVYDSSLWRGRRFETAMHIVFCAMWAYITGVLVWAASV
jgi:hypothetical protein